MISTRAAGILLAMTGAMALAQPVIAADAMMTTQETLLDRIQIEDLMRDYYTDLTATQRHAIDRYWAKDSEFHVAGQVIKGRDAIAALYDGMERAAGNGEKLTMLLGNPLIHVHGDTAEMDAIYTGIMNVAPDQAPEFFEQGQDHCEFVKENGRWLITKRVLTTLSHAPAGD
jgi:ketosteroid isomerase-like protein